MFKTILVAVDGSDNANKAAETAIDLAEKYGASLIALSVYRHISQLESTHSLVRARKVPEPPDQMMSELSRDAVNWVVDRAKDAGLNDVSTEVKRGPITRTILDVAKKNKVDAIVLGNRGLGDFSGLLLGSVSHKVNSLCECTCITVK